MPQQLLKLVSTIEMNEKPKRKAGQYQAVIVDVNPFFLKMLLMKPFLVDATPEAKPKSKANGRSKRIIKEPVDIVQLFKAV